MMTPGVFRFLLALTVVIHHSFPLRLGGWAVGIFFVLSGFWISSMWRSGYSRKRSPYLTFVVSRWLRIAPLFLAVHLIAIAMVLLGLWPRKTDMLADWRWWSTQTTIVGSTQFGHLLPPSWSLDVEMQFYLIAPLLVTVLGYLVSPKVDEASSSTLELRVGSQKNQRAWRLMVVLSMLLLSASWCLWRLTHGATLGTPHLDIYIWLFLTGLSCELLEVRFPWWAAMLSSVVLVLLVICIYASPATRHLIWFRGSDTVSGSPFAAAIFFVTMVIVAIPLALFTVRQSSSHVDRWLGDLSYPLYLFHWIPRDWYYANVDWSLGSLRNGGLLCANLAMAILGAIFLLRLVDRPIQHRRQAWVKSKA